MLHLDYQNSKTNVHKSGGLIMQKIKFSADYEVKGEAGTGLPDRILLNTPELEDEGWFADNNIRIEYDTLDNSATIRLTDNLTDSDTDAAGTSYAHDILDDYFVHFEHTIKNGKPVLIFKEPKDKPEGSGLSEEEFEKQMHYFDDDLKDKIETYFEKIIDEIDNYLKKQGYVVREWD